MHSLTRAELQTSRCSVLRVGSFLSLQEQRCSQPLATSAVPSPSGGQGRAGPGAHGCCTPIRGMGWLRVKVPESSSSCGSKNCPTLCCHVHHCSSQENPPERGQKSPNIPNSGLFRTCYLDRLMTWRLTEMLFFKKNTTQGNHFKCFFPPQAPDSLQPPQQPQVQQRPALRVHPVLW